MSIIDIWNKLNEMLEILDKIYHIIDDALEKKEKEKWESQSLILSAHEKSQSTSGHES